MQDTCKIIYVCQTEGMNPENVTIHDITMTTDKRKLCTPARSYIFSISPPPSLWENFSPIYINVSLCLYRLYARLVYRILARVIQHFIMLSDYAERRFQDIHQQDKDHYVPIIGIGTHTYTHTNMFTHVNANIM